MKCLYFYDCPRTGGTSIKKWCKSKNNFKRLHYGTRPAWHHVPFKPLELIDKELRPKNYSQKIWTFTFLRNPYEHTLSLYAKIRNHKHAYAGKFKKMSFSDWILGDFPKDVVSTPQPWGFSFVRFYDPETGNLEKAIKNLESIDFIGFTERLNSDMNLFLNKMSSTSKFDNRKLNISQKNFKVDDKLREIIKQVRSNDYKLVNHFRSLRGLKLYESA